MLKFGTSDIRGIFNKEFNLDYFSKLCYSLSLIYSGINIIQYLSNCKKSIEYIFKEIPFNYYYQKKY